MSTETITLKDGFRVGDQVHTVVTLKLPSAGDIIDAGVEAERAVLTEQGYVLLMSPTLTAQHVLRRQIVCIGTHPGPLTLSELKKLSADDLQLLQLKAEGLDGALLKALESRGRSEAPGEGAGGR